MIAIKIVSTGRYLAQHPHTSQCTQKVLFGSGAHNQLLSSTYFVANNQQHFQPNRSLSSSTEPKKQQLSNTDKQYLVHVARNIYFRQCRANKPSSKSFSVSASNKETDIHPYVSDSTVPQEQVFCYPVEKVASDNLKFKTTNNNNLKNNNDRNSNNNNDEFPNTRISTTTNNRVDSNEGNSSFYGQTFDRPLTSPFASGTKLVVLMSWLSAQEKHIEKYRQYYLERGYDVLNVKTSPLDVLLPAVGAKKISRDFVKFLTKNSYQDVVLHSFSVGGYQFGEFVIEVEKQDTPTKRRILNSIKGVVFDSPVPIEQVGIGVSNSITSNKLVAKFLQGLIELYMVLAKNFATQYYEKASEKVWRGPLTCPSLFFYSKDDKVSDFKIVRKLAETWARLGIQVQQVVFDSSPHVQHFQTHNNQYVNKLQQFLKEIRV